MRQARIFVIEIKRLAAEAVNSSNVYWSDFDQCVFIWSTSLTNSYVLASFLLLFIEINVFFANFEFLLVDAGCLHTVLFCLHAIQSWGNLCTHWRGHVSDLIAFADAGCVFIVLLSMWDIKHIYMYDSIREMFKQYKQRYMNDRDWILTLSETQMCS